MTTRQTILRAIATVAIVILASPSMRAASPALLQIAFNKPFANPCVSVVGDAKVTDGVLRSTSMANWKRGGLEVGPLPMPTTALTVDYDFRPVRFGRQSQEFTSQQPSTHHYMIYAHPGGRMNLHTRLKGKEVCLLLALDEGVPTLVGPVRPDVERDLYRWREWLPLSPEREKEEKRRESRESREREGK